MTPEQKSFQVAGVDGCKAGWLVAIAAVMEEYNRIPALCVFELKRVLVAATFAEVLSETTGCELVCVDIPIGLSDGPERRACDLAARKALGGKRASSVFPAPIRPCLLAKDYETASRISFKRSGKKLNKQSFALLAKIRQVDDLMTPEFQRRVREIHPEISFWALSGEQPLQQNKKTVPGQARRHKLLQEIFSGLDSILAQAPARGYMMDDALDALAAVWTAGQTVLGKAKTLPEKPELDSKDLRMEILYPVK